MQDSVHDAEAASSVPSSWYDESVNMGASSSRATPAEVPHRAVSFTEVLPPEDDDLGSVVSVVSSI